MRNRKAVLIPLLLVVALAACTKQVHVKHPNQINDLDGYGYDSLTVAQASLDEAKVQLAAHKFDDRRSSAVEIINAGGAAYDTAHVTWETYRDVLMGLKQGDVLSLEVELRQDLSDMAAAVARVKSLSGGVK
jgi:hypothetical protein